MPKDAIYLVLRRDIEVEEPLVAGDDIAREIVDAGLGNGDCRVPLMQ